MKRSFIKLKFEKWAFVINALQKRLGPIGPIVNFFNNKGNGLGRSFEVAIHIFVIVSYIKIFMNISWDSLEQNILHSLISPLFLPKKKNEGF